MTNLNSFSVAGNLTGDPKIKTDENGEVRSVLFNVAVNRSKDKADFIPVRLSGAQYTAHMQQKLVKGAGVILNGRVENTQYKDQNGQNRSFFAVTPSYMIAGPRGSVNNGTVHGRLTHDPELRKTPQGKSVVALSSACNRSYKNGNGEWVDAPASFLNVVAWEAQAEFVCKYFHKGDPILVCGSIQSRQYTTKEGEQRTAYEILANNVSFASERDAGANATPAPAAQKPLAAANPGEYSAEDFAAVADDEDLPF